MITYLVFNLVLVVAVGALGVCAPLLCRMDAVACLRLHYSVIVFAIAISAAASLMPGGEIVPPVVHVWADASAPAPTKGISRPSKGVVMAAQRKVPVAANYIFLFMVGLLGGAALGGSLYIWREWRQLRALLSRSHRLRAVGRVRVLVSDETGVPFSCRGLRRFYVLVPAELLTNPVNLRLVIAHELQHHRQGDTTWAYALVALRCLCFFNPAVHLWSRWIGETQEFACDETLVGRQRKNAQAYARCLIEVAETGLIRGSLPVCATGMIFPRKGSLLNRRIHNMFQENLRQGRRLWWVPLALIAGLLTATAFASKGLVQDRRVTFAQAQEYATAAQLNTEFPVVVNESVVYWLNRYVGTQEGREKMRATLERMEKYRAMVAAKIGEYEVPMELMALPIVESGYRNLEPKHNGLGAAGLWQFIASTARRYGLRVWGNVDQRLNEELETDAAMRYLLANKLRFKDWQLALLAYNQGENSVQNGIFETGSRDAWKLIEAGYEGDRGYLPKMMAAILIMKNPGLVQ